MKVYIEGQLQTRKWQDQTGNDRYTTEVVLQKFRGELQMLDARGQGGDGADRSAAAAARISASQGRATTRAVAIAAAAVVAAAAVAAVSRATSTTRFRSEGLRRALIRGRRVPWW